MDLFANEYHIWKTAGISPSSVTDRTSTKKPRGRSVLFPVTGQAVDEEFELTDYLEKTLVPMVGEDTTDHKFRFQTTSAYWKEMAACYPTLFSMYRFFLCTPASESSVERIFSTGRRIVTDLRTHLAEDMVEKLLFLRYNYKIIDPSDEEIIFDQAEAAPQ